MTHIERFMLRVEPDLNTGCWLWSGGQTSDGYGVFQLHRRTLLAHRAAWELFHGVDPKGKLVCHRCDTPSCVNPEHLFLGDQAANMADMKAKGRASRKHGQRNGRAVLTDDLARELIDVDGLGIFSRREIARSYGLPESRVYKVLSRQTFRHINPIQPGQSQ